MKLFNRLATGLFALLVTLLLSGLAQAAPESTGEASLVVPNAAFATVTFMGDIAGRTLLLGGLGVALAGMVFGLVIYMQLKNAPVHKSMLEISELIYETCKTYLQQQMKFILLLEIAIGTVMAIYFGAIEKLPVDRVIIILVFSLVGIAGSS